MQVNDVKDILYIAIIALLYSFLVGKERQQCPFGGSRTLATRR